MATRIQAIRAYCPRVRRSAIASPELFMKLTIKRTTLSSGVVKNVQESEVETLIDLLLEGQSVHTGTVTYKPCIELNGTIRVAVQVDARILSALNTPRAFRGPLVNAENVGQSSNELVQIWNTDHPDDPVV